MRRILISVLVLFALGCPPGAWHQLYAEDYVVATIGEQKIYYSEIQMAAQELNKFLKENFDANRDWQLSYIRQYVAKQAVAKRAVEEGLDKDPQVQFNIEQSRKAILADKLLGDALAKIKYTEEDMKSYYEQNKARYRDQEQASFSYIKVATKSEADKIVEGLNKGKSFEKLGGKNIQKTQIQPRMGLFVPEVKGAKPEDIDGLFSLGISGYSTALGSTDGYYIFRMDRKIEAKERPYETVRSSVESEYMKTEQDKVINRVVKDIFVKEKVVINEAGIK
jgi:peptidyl-prolyl cis-trans isomerase C